jgi:hypothetical protein
MATVSFNEFLKQAKGTAKDVKTVSSKPIETQTGQSPADYVGTTVDVLKGKTSFPASIGGAETILPNVAKTIGNLPSSAAKLTTAPLITAAENAYKSGEAVAEISGIKNISAGQKIKSVLGGMFDTYTQLGEKIYGSLSKAYNAVLDNPEKAKADFNDYIIKTGIEDPLFIPTLLYGGSKAVGKDSIEALGKPIASKIEAGISGVGEKIGSTVQQGAEILAKGKTSLFGRPLQIKSVDDVISQADESLKPSQILAKTEQTTAIPSLKEKWAGISPDIKNRISGKQEKLKEYFDVAHARNNLDTLPTPLEYGVKNDVIPAVEKMQSLLNDTGSNIGKFRTKVSTYKATPDDMASIDNAFNKQLDSLNLELKNGNVRQKAGTVKRVNSDAEINILNDIYQDMKVVKQSPDVQRLIDLRNIFDSKINFAKSARDVSSSLDPLSRTMRGEIARINAKLVGTSEARNLAKYSDFMDAFNELRSFTDRKAGAEFLLKQALSERGRTAMQIMKTIKDHTGIDLMDTATMSSIATDLIGNSRQKGLFRQEITKAGLDAASLLSGNTAGGIMLMYDALKKNILNSEKAFLEAAK